MQREISVVAQLKRYPIKTVSLIFRPSSTGIARLKSLRSRHDVCEALSVPL
jgi:hypothetical protein